MAKVSFEEWCIQCDIRGVTHFITICDADEKIHLNEHVSKFLKQLKSVKFNLRSNYDQFTWYIIPLDLIKKLKYSTDNNIVIDQRSDYTSTFEDEVLIYYKTDNFYAKLFSISYKSHSVQNMNELLNDTLQSAKQYAIDTQNVIDILKQLTHGVE